MRSIRQNRTIRPSLRFSKVQSNNSRLVSNIFANNGIQSQFSTLNSSQVFTTKNLVLNGSKISQNNMRFYSSGPSTIQVPSMGESISEGTIQEWLKNEGDYVEVDEVIAQIETDKVVVDVRAPSAGVIQKVFAGEGDNIEVGQDLFILDTSAAKPEGSTQPEKKTESVEEKKVETPKEETKQQTPKAPPQPASQPSGSAREGTEGLERRVKMSRMRQRIAQRLKESQNTYAMLTTFNEVDMTNLMKLRSEFKDDFEKKHGIKLGFMSAFVKASTVALQHVPAINAVIDGEEIVYRDYCDVGVAVATPTGLVVPVLRNCQEKSFAQIESDISNYGKKAREGRISMDDMQGGTFTISNGGVFGSLMGTPIINPPQSAILGMHAIKKRPVAIGDSVEVRPMMYLALTYDHRLIDGKEAVTFLVKLKECIEDPRRLLLDL